MRACPLLPGRRCARVRPRPGRGSSYAPWRDPPRAPPGRALSETLCSSVALSARLGEREGTRRLSDGEGEVGRGLESPTSPRPSPPPGGAERESRLYAVTPLGSRPPRPWGRV